MSKNICDLDCFNCKFDDCRNDGSRTKKEGEMLKNAGVLPESKRKKYVSKPKTEEQKQRLKEWKKQYNKKNKEKIKEYKSKYYKEHKDEFILRNKKARENKKAAPGRQSQ